MKHSSWILFSIVLALSLIVIANGQAEPSPSSVQAREPQPVLAPEREGLVVLQKTGLGGITSVAFAPSDPKYIYAGGEHGLSRSTDGGRSWQLLSSELRLPRILLVHPANSQVLLASREVFVDEKGPGALRIFKSTDGGVSWHIKERGIEQQDIFSLALNPNEPQILYAGGRNGQIFKSTDEGENWELEKCLSLEGFPPRTVIQLVIHPNTGDLYAVEDHLGVFRSTDGGQSWIPIHRSSGQLVLESRTDTLYLAGWRLWKSTDQGKSWQDISGNLPLYLRTGSPMITWLGVNPEPPILYVGRLHRQVYRSFDGGKNWTLLDIRTPFVPQAIKVGQRPELYGSSENDLGRYVDVP